MVNPESSSPTRSDQFCSVVEPILHRIDRALYRVALALGWAVLGLAVIGAVTGGLSVTVGRHRSPDSRRSGKARALAREQEAEMRKPPFADGFLGTCALGGARILEKQHAK